MKCLTCSNDDKLGEFVGEYCGPCYAKRLNPHRHFWFYAKHWYDHPYYNSECIIKNLKIIQADYCGCLPEYLTLSNITEMLLKIIEPHIQSGKIDFKDFMFNIHSENCWKIGYSVKCKHNSWLNKNEDQLEEYDYPNAVIFTCLSYMRNLTVKEFGELGEPDYNLLPKGRTFESCINLFYGCIKQFLGIKDEEIKYE